jgi:arylformamidase
MIGTQYTESPRVEPLSVLFDSLKGQPLDIVDLTYNLEAGMPTFTAPWHPAVTVSQMGHIDIEGRTTHSFTLGTHTGTHIDAPLHFIEHGKGIEAISLHKLIGPVSIVDCTHLEKNQVVTLDFLKQFPVTTRMIFKFGWEQFWKTPQFFQDWPFFTNDAAQYLVDNGLELIGLDTPSPDDSRIPFKSEHDSQVHKIFLSHEVVILEYVANLSNVTQLDGWTLIVMPLKLKGLDGAPSRVCLIRSKDVQHSNLNPTQAFTADKSQGPFNKLTRSEISQWLQDWLIHNTSCTRENITSDYERLNYFEAGFVDSFGYVEMIASIEEQFQIEFSNDDFQDRHFATIGGLTDAIYQSVQQKF